MAQTPLDSKIIVVLNFFFLCFHPLLCGPHHDGNQSPPFSEKAICLFTGILLL